MANANVFIRKMEFVVNEKSTHCNILYESDEPGTPWGGVWKTKSFPAETTAETILAEEVKGVLMWENGHQEIIGSMVPWAEKETDMKDRAQEYAGPSYDSNLFDFMREQKQNP